MKAAILTINDYSNYGNRLQNYAVQEVLKKHEFEVKTIVHNLDTEYLISQYSTNVNGNKIDNKFTRFLKLNNKQRIQMMKNKYILRKSKSAKENKINRFKMFTNKYILEDEIGISEQNIPEKLGDCYDLFVTGSDQVWNPNFRHGSPIDFLTFAVKEKRLALSASFGVSEIPKRYHNNYKKWLSEMPFISVREDAGANIIKELTDREVPVLIDPTLMLNKGEWLSISSVHNRKPESPYLLTYLLGKESYIYSEVIKSIANENNLVVVNLADINNEKYFDVHPGEFIDYINSANVFCTDSFHGIIFSTIMHTPFIVFTREEAGPSMNSRIDTLMSTLNIENRHYNQVSKNKKWLCAVNRDLEIRNKQVDMNTFLNTFYKC